MTYLAICLIIIVIIVGGIALNMYLKENGALKPAAQNKRSDRRFKQAKLSTNPKDYASLHEKIFAVNEG